MKTELNASHYGAFVEVDTGQKHVSHPLWLLRSYITRLTLDRASARDQVDYQDNHCYHQHEMDQGSTAANP